MKWGFVELSNDLVNVVEMNNNINDDEFALAAAKELIRLMNKE